jgi:N-acetylneuraminic acid mutarotase
VLVAGGLGNVGGSWGRAELYDPATGHWTITGSLNAARWLHTATLLTNGKVLIAGGVKRALNPLSRAELYDPTTSSWTITGSLNTGRFYHTATLLANGQVLAAGGDNDLGLGYLASAELYDP